MTKILKNIFAGASTMVDSCSVPNYAEMSHSNVSDEDAIRSDWEKVGSDLRNAKEKLDREQKE